MDLSKIYLEEDMVPPGDHKLRGADLWFFAFQRGKRGFLRL
jgi:hypothetical protein